MLAGFRNRVPQRSGLVKLLVDLMRLRAVQISAVAAILAGACASRSDDHRRKCELRRAIGKRSTLSEQLARQPISQAAAVTTSSSRRLGIEISDELAAGRPRSRFARSRNRRRRSAQAKRKTKAESSLKLNERSSQDQISRLLKKPATQAQPKRLLQSVANRKLIRNATVELEIVSFDDAVQKITAFANEEHGYVATTDSEKQANGKLRGASRRQGPAGKSRSLSAKDSRALAN